MTHDPRTPQPAGSVFYEEWYQGTNPAPWKAGEGYEQCSPGYYISDAKGLIVVADTEGTLSLSTLNLIVNMRNELERLRLRVMELQAERHRLDDLLVRAYQAMP